MNNHSRLTISVNHYTTYVIKYQDPKTVDSTDMWKAFMPDVAMSFTDKEGKEIGKPAGLSWVRPVPWGFGKLLSWLHEMYGWDIYM
jgi:beta-glucosidase